MDRRTFLGRSLAAVGALSLGRLPRPAPAGAAEVEAGVVRDSLVTPTNDYALFASGGLCAPVTPYYQLAVLDTVSHVDGARIARPVRDALPIISVTRNA